MSLAEDLARDADVFLDTSAFGVVVRNGSTVSKGIVDVRDFHDEEGGLQVQRRRRVLTMQAGTGGTIESGTMLEVDGVNYRVERPLGLVPPDGLFTEYLLAGGAT